VAAIGNTPLVPLCPPKGCNLRVWAKLEQLNPTGSIKDRVAWAMLADALKKQRLRPGGWVVEPTSGNTGIALAALAAPLDYRFCAIVPETINPRRRRLLESYGASLRFSPGEEGANGAVLLALALRRDHPEWFFPMQYENPASVAAHQFGTAAEIICQLGSAPDVVIAGLGTGGTLMGCVRALPDATIVAVEPDPEEEGVIGLRSLEAGYTPAILKPELLSRRLLIGQAEAREGCGELRRREGLALGESSGAVYAALKRIAPQLPSAANVVCIFADGADRYEESLVIKKHTATA